jgi:hypothetical protein
MSKVIIGIDPDSKAHGVAIYIDGRLSRLECLTLYWLVDALDFYHGNDIEIHIEDVCANNAVFRIGNNQKVAGAMGRSIGKVQQSQIELERFIHHKMIKVVKHKISKMWKKDKKQFEKVTDWSGQSNEDTRSAAYFGWLGCN